MSRIGGRSRPSRSRVGGIRAAGGTAFAVGDYRDGSRTHSLIEHFG